MQVKSAGICGRISVKSAGICGGEKLAGHGQQRISTKSFSGSGREVSDPASAAQNDHLSSISLTETSNENFTLTHVKLEQVHQQDGKRPDLWHAEKNPLFGEAEYEGTGEESIPLKMYFTAKKQSAVIRRRTLISEAAQSRMIGEEEAFEDRCKKLREQQQLLNNLAATKIQSCYRAHAHRRRLIAEKLLQNSHTQADWDTKCPQTESIMAVIAEQQAAQANAYAKAKKII